MGADGTWSCTHVVLLRVPQRVETAALDRRVAIARLRAGSAQVRDQVVRAMRAAGITGETHGDGLVLPVLFVQCTDAEAEVVRGLPGVEDVVQNGAAVLDLHYALLDKAPAVPG